MSTKHLEDLLKFLKENHMSPKEFSWYIIGKDTDVETLLNLKATCFGETPTRKDFGLTGIDFVIIEKVTEDNITRAWDIVSKDSGSLILIANPIEHNFQNLSAIVSHYLPYEDSGMIVDISKNGYTGLLVRRTQ